MSEAVLAERRGAAAILTLNRPKALNALTLAMFHEIGPLLDAWAHDPAVGCILVRGAGGKAFCAGGDVKAMNEAKEAGPGALGQVGTRR